MSRAFPGGIADDKLAAAYVRVGDELVAIDLASGAVMWRQAGAGEPLAAAGRYLLTRQDGPDGPILALFEAASGRAIRSLAAAQLPGFAAVSPGDALAALISDSDDGLEISWKSSRRYGGGAMPGMGMAGGGGSAGAVRLASATGPAHAIAAAPAPPAPTTEPIAGGPNTIAAARLAGAEFALESSGGEVRLEARSPDGARRWSTSLGRAGPARPGPLRQ